MRILFFNYEYPPLGGGAANATEYILKEFSKIPELEVDLVTSSIDEKYHLEKLGNNIQIHRLPIGKNQTNLHHQSQKDLIIYTIKAYFFARKLIKQSSENKFSLTHSFFTVPCGFLSWILFYQFKLPYIVSLRGSDVPGYSERFKFLYKFITPAVKLIWGKAAAVVANSQGLKELALQSDPQRKIGVIYNGIDIDDFRPNAEKQSGDRFIITPGASRLTARKGIKYLIDAVAKLAPKYPQIYLKIMGEGSEMENLQTQAKSLGINSRVEFVGRISHNETPPFYQEARAFVLPSLNEGMSNAMLEALAVGLPLLATDTGGTKELVTENENGFIIKMKDSDDIATKIEKLISNPDLQVSMSKNSRERAEKMSWQNVAMDYFGEYKKIQQDNNQ